MSFNAKEESQNIINWIKNWFDKNGSDCCAVVGISGGKDSSVVASLCVEALGKDRVFGVLMPNTEQSDINVSRELCKYLDIENITINIGKSFDSLMEHIECNIPVSEQSKINLAPRLRMSTLYAVSQSLNGRVANTCNLSEDWVGYATRYGDSVGDFSPLSDLTVSEVKQIGAYLGLPEMFVEKVPIDGLSGKTDEDNLGFTYDVLDKYIRTGICECEETKNKIDSLHEKNIFKLKLMDKFEYTPKSK